LEFVTNMHFNYVFREQGNGNLYCPTKSLSVTEDSAVKIEGDMGAEYNLLMHYVQINFCLLCLDIKAGFRRPILSLLACLCVRLHAKKLRCTSTVPSGTHCWELVADKLVNWPTALICNDDVVPAMSVEQTMTFGFTSCIFFDDSNSLVKTASD
jgi:hypothetical protein